MMEPDYPPPPFGTTLSKSEFIKRELDAIHEAAQAAMISREAAIAFLQRAKILDENGKLAEPYRS
jgi:hypothetical protein